MRDLSSIREALDFLDGEGPGAVARLLGRAGGHVLDEGLHLFGNLVHEGPLRAMGANKIVGQTFSGGKDGGIILRVDGPGVEIAYCLFTDVRGRGVSIDGDAARPGKNAHVHHCHFRRWLGPTGSHERQHGHEAVQIGRIAPHTATPVQALVELNLFEDVTIDSETISIKSSNNTVRQNTLIKCKTIMNRHGRSNKIISNFLQASRGVVLFDHGGYCMGNKADVFYMRGSVTADAWRQLASQHGGEGQYPAAEAWTLFDNEGGWREDGYEGHDSVAPKPPTELSKPPSGIAVPPARRLTAAEVGPVAQLVDA